MIYYCYSTDPGWRKNNRGIDDDVIVLVDDQGENEADVAAAKKLRQTCCLNLAACKLHLQKYEECIKACDVALELDPGNVKALYRRAEARIRPSKATAYEHDCAIKDLAEAAKIEPDNKIVDKLLTQLRGERKVQRDKDTKTFSGMFNRGELYRKEDESTVHVPKNNEADMKDIQHRIDGISDEDTLEKRTADAELLRDLYMRNGKEEEARELNDKIKVAKQAIRDREDRPVMNWENPTEEMIDDAKKHGLDLTDPLVIEEMKRLEREGLGAIPPEELGDEDEMHPQVEDVTDQRNSDLPLPEVDYSVEVPWMRYIALFFAIFAAWHIINSGIARLVVGFFWRKLRFFSSAQDAEKESARESLFALAYKKIVNIFGGQGEEGEL